MVPKKQNYHANKSKGFHERYLHDSEFMRPSLSTKRKRRGRRRLCAGFSSSRDTNDSAGTKLNGDGEAMPELYLHSYRAQESILAPSRRRVRQRTPLSPVLSRVSDPRVAIP